MRSALCCVLVCDNLRESAVKYLPLFLLCLYLCLLVASLRDDLFFLRRPRVARYSVLSTRNSVLIC